ncbi:hypothetical protein Pan110_60180 [Gimesia panareensis]|nr:hypothetical protein Pan110_60180 [Gimesia panareensis]
MDRFPESETSCFTETGHHYYVVSTFPNGANPFKGPLSGLILVFFTEIRDLGVDQSGEKLALLP